MPRRKRTSPILEKAERRAAGMRSIKIDLDLGNGMTLEGFWADLDGLREKQNEYNSLLSKVDQAYNELLAEEQRLSEVAEKMLSAVAVKYGRSSTEYEMAGGVRRPERRRVRRTTEATQEG